MNGAEARRTRDAEARRTRQLLLCICTEQRNKRSRLSMFPSHEFEALLACYFKPRLERVLTTYSIAEGWITRYVGVGEYYAVTLTSDEPVMPTHDLERAAGFAELPSRKLVLRSLPICCCQRLQDDGLKPEQRVLTIAQHPNHTYYITMTAQFDCCSDLSIGRYEFSAPSLPTYRDGYEREYPLESHGQVRFRPMLGE